MQEFEEITGFLEGLRPNPIMEVSEWADAHRWLAPGTTPEPGRWRTSRIPFTKDIMNALSEHATYRYVIWKKSAQTAATEVGLNWLGYLMDVAPASTLCVMPTAEQMTRNSKMRIAPMIAATPRLAMKIGPTNKRDGNNTLLQKDLPGMSLLMTGANSPSGLRSMPVKNVMGDEVDGYPLDLNGEGSPVSLFEARTNTYKRFKIYLLSTPTQEGVSVISAEYEKTDQNECFVPCPHCGTMDTLKWEHMWWEGKGTNKVNVVQAPRTARYICPHCEGEIFEGHKEEMLASYEWRPTKPENVSPDIIGFHINAMYSPFYPFSRMVSKYLRAGNDLTKLNAFTNTDLGLESKPLTDAPKWNMLYDKAEIRPENQPTNDVKFVTVGVDVQLNRLELHIVGWGYDKRRWVLDYRVLPGNVMTDDAWNELDKVLNEFFIRPDGVELPVSKMAVDSGSYTSQVYKWCARHDRRVQAIKGDDKMPKILGSLTAVNKNDAGKDMPGLMLQMVGSSYMKTELYGYLMLNKMDDDQLGPQGYIHLIKRDERYFRGLVAEEERVKQDKKGRNVYEWYTIFERNEPLDTMNYARAAAAMVGLDRHGLRLNEWMDELETSFVRAKEPAPEKPKNDGFSNKEGGYWEHWDDKDDE